MKAGIDEKWWESWESMLKRKCENEPCFRGLLEEAVVEHSRKSDDFNKEAAIMIKRVLTSE
tara:strand:+ start:335 stop:517 length:183 start_codon:yes stop_codon:yes gene_type:complete